MAFRKERADELQAYVELMISHQDRLRAFIYTLMPGNPDDQDDVLQNTNAVLWQKRHKFQLGTNFTAWAFKIARFQVRHQAARERRDGRLVFSDDLLDRIAETSPTDSGGDTILSALEGCISKLTDQQREIIDERYMKGHSLANLAERTGRSAGSLRIALHRIREVLKACVKKNLAGQTT